MNRKHYVDNLRWICIVLLIPYHAAMAYNTWGEGNYIFFYPSRVLSSFVVGVSPWYMTLLFVLAGMSARYSLEKRTSKEFIKERLTKLLLPMITGTLVVVPIMAYLADKIECSYNGNILDHYMVFFTKWTQFTGYDGGFTIGHLWFLLNLFIISIMSIVIVNLVTVCTKHIKTDIAKDSCITKKSVKPICLYVALFFPVIAKSVEIGGEPILSYLLLYLIGYYILSDDNILKNISKYWGVFLSIFLVCTIADVYMFLWSSNSSDILNDLVNKLCIYFGIVTMLSLGYRFLNKQNKVTHYLTTRCFFLYIFHYVWTIYFQYVYSIILENAYANYILAIICALPVALITCEIVKCIPVINFLFGIKGKK